MDINDDDVKAILEEIDADEEDHIFTDKEYQQLIIAFTAAGESGISKEDLLSCIRWAEGVRIEEMMLNMVLDGVIAAHWINDEIHFTSPTPELIDIVSRFAEEDEGIEVSESAS